MTGALGDVQAAAPGWTEVVPLTDHQFRAQFRTVEPGPRSFWLELGSSST